MDDDAVVKRLVAVFEQAKVVARAAWFGPRNPEMEMPAMDLLMDYALTLGPTGLVDVMTALLAETEKPINSSPDACGHRSAPHGRSRTQSLMLVCKTCGGPAHAREVSPWPERRRWDHGAWLRQRERVEG